jgi:hypothetical protein
VKGNPGGPGAPRITKELREARKLTKSEAEKILNELIYLSVGELKDKIKDDKASVLKTFIASILAQGIREGDQKRLDFVFDRTIGRVKENVELSGPEGGPIKTHEMTKDEVRAELKRIEKRKAELGED